MSTHFNIQINIQQVNVKESATNYRAQGRPETSKSTVEVASLKVVADTEAEAFEKAFRMLGSAAPVKPVHVHAASCDDPGGNRICGEVTLEDKIGRRSR